MRQVRQRRCCHSLTSSLCATYAAGVSLPCCACSCSPQPDCTTTLTAAHLVCAVHGADDQRLTTFCLCGAGEDDEGDGLYEPTAEDEEDAEGDEHYCSGEVVDSDGADDSGALGGDSGDRVPAGRAAARRQQKAAPSLATANTGRGQRGRGRGRGNASSGRGRGRGNASSGARHGRGRGRGAGRGAARRGRRAGRGGDADEDAPSDSTPTTPLQQQQQQQQPATFFNLPKFPSPSGLAGGLEPLDQPYTVLLLFAIRIGCKPSSMACMSTRRAMCLAACC